MGAARVQDRDPIESIKSVLRSCQLFTGAADGVIDFVAAHVETISFAKGEPIILENENNDHVYFVAEGAVEIVSYIVDEKRVQRLALLRPGSQFAEFSVLTKSTKSGSAYAYEASHLLRLKGTHFIELLKKFPAVSSKLAADLAALNERVESGNDFVPYYQASDLKVARGITDIIPQSSWKKFGVIPLVHRGGVLSVALMDPNNDEFFQFVRGHLSGVEVNAYLIDEDDYETAFDFVKNWLRSNGSAEVRSKSVPPLPSDVKAMLSAFSLTALLPESVHAQLLPLLKPIAAKAGQIICAPKTQHDKLLLVVSGSVE
ncbi:MAG: cyclic nucleotide-binding domain-containing protein, partial [Bdellovibrionaceae bacterium]|nr:cyclic nucleotide-binding domain-containing protein [Pseudobdellovibrionaceae bacterium]